MNTQEQNQNPRIPVISNENEQFTFHVNNEGMPVSHRIDDITTVSVVESIDKTGYLSFIGKCNGAQNAYEFYDTFEEACEFREAMLSII